MAFDPQLIDPEDEEMVNGLVIWPPYVEYVYSIQKRYTYFGETISFLDKQPGFSVNSLDGTAQQYFLWDFITEYAKGYDFLAVYTDLHNATHAIRASQQCKRISPATVSVAFGEGVPYIPTLLVEEGFDAAITSVRWEEAILGFIRMALSGKVREIPGVTCRLNSHIVHCEDGRRPEMRNLPFPDLAHLPVEQYKRISGRDQLCLTVARGCPYRCRFCRVPLSQGRFVAYKSVDEILEYLAEVINKFGSIKFIAPTFTANREWVLSLCEGIRAKNLQFNWIVTTHLELIDEELILEMANAGCVAIAFGLESLYPETQHRVDKHLPQEDVLRVTAIMRQRGIIPKAFVMLGIPYQTAEEITELYQFLRENEIEIRPKEYYPYERLLETKDRRELCRLLEWFTRDDVYKSSIKGVSAQTFVNWLNDRTGIR